MKKRIVSVLAAICFCMSAIPSTTIVGTAAFSDKEYMINDYEVAKKYYNDIVSDKEWKSTISREERGNKLQLDNETMDNMSTDALIEAVLDYPFFMDVYCFDDIQDGFNVMYKTFNGVRTLSERDDVGSVMLKKYKEEEVVFTESGDTDVFRLTDLEILLAQDFVIQTLDENEKDELIKAATEKMSQKVKSDMYGELTDTIFFDLLKSNTCDSELVAQADSILATSYVSTVNTPNGTAVTVTVSTSEPLSTAEISAYDSYTATEYPNAFKIRSASGKYNCHSYAWYSQSTSNNKWMNNPSAYWTDGSYSPNTSSTAPDLSDKIVYFSSGIADHSGIVTYRYAGPSMVNFIDLINVNSKWGPAGLYSHRGNDCPYIPCDYVSYYN